MSDYDEMANNLVATGALFAVLSRASVVQPGFSMTLPEIGPGNQIDIRFSFLKSAYRLTVERVPDDDDQ